MAPVSPSSLLTGATGYVGGRLLALWSAATARSAV
jgi:thioester reductase-like protein